MPDEKDYFDRVDYENFSLTNNKIITAVLYFYICSIKSFFNQCYCNNNYNGHNIEY